MRALAEWKFMRTPVILSIIIGFAVAVILPNDIGTNDLPATGAKGLVVKPHCQSLEPVKGGPTVLVTGLDLRNETTFGFYHVDSYRCAGTACNGHLNRPLLM